MLGEGGLRYHKCHAFSDLTAWPKGGACSPQASNNFHTLCMPAPIRGYPLPTSSSSLAMGTFLGPSGPHTWPLGHFLCHVQDPSAALLGRKS